MFEGLPDVGEYVARLVLRRRVPGPLGIVIYHHLGDLMNAAEYALSHYFPISLDEPYLQNSSLGTPYQKWAYFTNKDFAEAAECLRRLIVATFHYYEHTNDSRHSDEITTLKDASHWFREMATGYACCVIDPDRQRLATTAVDVTPFADSETTRFRNVWNRPPWERSDGPSPTVVRRTVIDIDDRYVVHRLHAEGAARLRQLRRVRDELANGLKSVLTVDDVLAGHAGHLSQWWIGVVTTLGTTGNPARRWQDLVAGDGGAAG
ncbi:MAG TPA: hypothetical protein VGI81_05455 [Tepidisphaeraceae bacterium]|jgi:hypothetical protein